MSIIPSKVNHVGRQNTNSKKKIPATTKKKDNIFEFFKKKSINFFVSSEVKRA